MRRQLHPVLRKAKGLQHGFGEVQAAFNLAHDLLACAEDVRVVLREAAHS